MKMTVGSVSQMVVDGHQDRPHLRLARPYLLGCAAAALALSLCTAPAHAEAEAQTPGSAAAADEGSGLAEIVVTAQKRSENLQRVPIAITAVPPQTLENAGIRTLESLPSVLPGLQISNIIGQLVPRVRGVGSTYTAAGIESPIAVYVDDVYHAFAADIDVDFADVAQLALLKGPQGTLFGRNSTGGVVQITTRAPTHEFKGAAQTSFDSYQTTSSNLFVSGGLTEDIAASVSLSYSHQGKGYGTNINTGDDINRLDNALTARVKLRALASDRVTIDLSGDYSKREGSTAADFRTPAGYSTLLPSPQPSRLWSINTAIDPRQEVKAGGVSMKVAADLGFATLQSISAYRDAQISYSFSAAATANPLRNAYTTYNSKQATEEINLISDPSKRLSWTIGLYYFYNDADIDFQAAIFGPFASTFTRQSFPGHQITKSLAGFAQGTYKLTDSTRVTAGIRYTSDRKTFTAQAIGFPVNGSPPVTLASVTDRPYRFKKPSWRLSIDTDVADGVLAYASYNRGLRSGGFNTTSATNPPFDTEQLDAYEIGLKNQLFRNTLRFNIGAFYYDYKNIQTNIFTTGSAVVTNAAAAENYGIDADLEFRATDNLKLNAGANWLHARFKSFPNASFSVPQPSGGAAFVSRDAAGNTLPFSSDFTYTLGATYTVDAKFGRIDLNATDSYNSGYYFEVDNRIKMNSFHIVNASALFTPEGKNFSLRFFVNNILNKAVATAVTSAPWGYQIAYNNQPRTYGGTFKINF